MNSQILDELFTLIEKRKAEMPENSYTTELFKKGDNKILKKVGEETTELVMSAVKNDKNEMICETADVFYHIFVLLAHKGISLSEVYQELGKRFGISGLEEKAKRKQK